ncbi:MAG: methyltransferase domain-containing protein [Rhodobacteraceae bacterium]|nr:methyltransferase domain-containing protein [Paracoccaceae bacterium]
MAETRDGKQLLEGAYNLSTPDDNIAYYKDFAAVYDTDFVTALGYVFPKLLAEHYLRFSEESDLPVADIGCGTGLVAEALQLPAKSIDGIDISSDMLEVSAAKNIYRSLYQADLTASVSHLPCDYGSVISAGTFTHGHLGPEPLKRILNLVRPNGLYCIGVNAVHFAQGGFGETLRDMKDQGQITSPIISELEMYQGEGHAHSQDKALVIQYRKT